MSDDERYMTIALHEAQLAADAGEVPVGCVLVADGQIVGRGHNQTEAMLDVTAHAEIIAITAAAQTLGGKYLTDCTLYVTVEPCIMCAGAIGWAQVGRIVYGCADDKRGYSLFSPSPLHPKTQVSSGVMESECRSLMQNFFAERRRK